MLDSLFPNGYFLLAILAFFMFALGSFMGVFIGSALERWSEGQLKHQSVTHLILIACLVGTILSFLFYHLAFDLIRGQLAC